MAFNLKSFGNGPDLALIHGWGLPAAVWAPVIEPLARRFRVHCVDLPGYGDNRALPPTSLPAIADMLMAALPEKVSLCAWSLGGHAAIGALARHAARIDKLILVAATPCFVKKPDWPHGVDPALLDTFAFALARDPKSLLGKFSALLNQGDARARELARLLAPLAAVPPAREVLAVGLEQLRAVDLRPLLARIRHPTLLIHGDADPLMPLAGARWMASALPHARLEVFAEAAHAPFLSQPERFVDTLSGFLVPQPAVA